MRLRLLASFGFGIAFVLAAVPLPGAQGRATPASQRPVEFATEIHPILQAKCLGCHGETLKLSKLDLRTREAAIDGGAHGPSLALGNAEQSRMYRDDSHDKARGGEQKPGYQTWVGDWPPPQRMRSRRARSS